MVLRKKLVKRLSIKRERKIGKMSRGEKDRLALLLALTYRPKLLLLDEPVSGLTGHEVELMRDLVSKIYKDLGITIIIIEHIMKFLMNISNEVLILNFGEVVCKGTPKEVTNNEAVIKCYLGEEFQEFLMSTNR